MNELYQEYLKLGNEIDELLAKMRTYNLLIKEQRKEWNEFENQYLNKCKEKDKVEEEIIKKLNGKIFKLNNGKYVVPIEDYILEYEEYNG